MDAIIQAIFEEETEQFKALILQVRGVILWGNIDKRKTTKRETTSSGVHITKANDYFHKIKHMIIESLFIVGVLINYKLLNHTIEI